MMNNFSYLRPPSYVIKKPIYMNNINGEQVITQSRQRTILSNQQNESLHRLREYVKHKYPNRKIDDNLLLRYCKLGQYNTSDSVDKFRNYDDWWAMPPIDKSKEKGILHSGVFYCYGRDYEYSPNIYFNPSRVQLLNLNKQDYLVSLRTLLTPIQQHMLYEDRIQQWNIIIDARNFNQAELRNNYPNYMNLIYKICYAYPYRTKRIFLLSPNNLFHKMGISKNNLSAIQEVLQSLGIQNKVIKVSNLKHFDKYISKDERQKLFGGNLENLTQFWPISSTNKLMEVNSRFIEGSEKSDSEYNSISNEANAQFFGERTQNPPPNCRCSIQ